MNTTTRLVITRILAKGVNQKASKRYQPESSLHMRIIYLSGSISVTHFKVQDHQLAPAGDMYNGTYRQTIMLKLFGLQSPYPVCNATPFAGPLPPTKPFDKASKRRCHTMSACSTELPRALRIDSYMQCMYAYARYACRQPSFVHHICVAPKSGTKDLAGVAVARKSVA